MHSRTSVIFAFLLLAAQASIAQAIHIDWDRGTLTLIQRGGGYARMARVEGGLLCCFENRGRCYVRRSTDEGKTWQDAVQAASFEFGNAANPELLYCRDGRLLLFFNQRPTDHVHPFSIAMVVSRDNGQTWSDVARPLFTAGLALGQGCYEPSAVQLPSGEIQLFFANEYPHRADGSQEITLLRSMNDGETWSASQAVSYRPHHRDGMPVPLVLANHKGIVFAIEDNGVTPDGEFKPTIIHSPTEAGWGTKPIGADSPLRWPAVQRVWPAHVYAGAPYLRQLPTGETLLSCQSRQGDHPPHMVVFIGDADAKHFTDPSDPFPGGEQTRGMWNSLFVKNADTVTAISGTRIDGISGVWAIDGHMQR